MSTQDVHCQKKAHENEKEIIKLIMNSWHEYHEIPIHAPADGYLAPPQYYAEIAQRIVRFALEDPGRCRAMLERFMPYIETASMTRARQRQHDINTTQG